MSNRRIDYGTRDNRGRTSPSSASGCPPEGGSDCRKQATTTVRRYGHIGKIVLRELVSLARACEDEQLARELERELGPVMDNMARFEVDITDVSPRDQDEGY